MRTQLALAGTAAVATVTAGAMLAYRRDLSAAHARLGAVDRSVISTTHGALEFAERGRGAPILVSMGSSTAVMVVSGRSGT